MNLRAGMTRLGPGIYDDGHGGLYVDTDEALDHLGWPHTPEAVDRLTEQIRDVARKHGIPMVEIER